MNFMALFGGLFERWHHSDPEDGTSGGTHGQGDTMPVASSTPVFYYE